ncbi:MAG: hypothetical protein V1837_02660 [Candidatus Woesearchaeota archaeon]
MRLSKSMARAYGLLITITVILAYMVFAGNRDPVGPEKLNVVDSQRMDSWGGAPIDAEAGNVTELFLNATSITQHWAGFYGNVSGIITLDDLSNSTMYDWLVAEPGGAVYATPRNPPVWTAIDCLNKTSIFNETELEHNLSMEKNDEDGVNETFCPGCNAGSKDDATTHPGFFVGTKQFLPGDCWALNTYVNNSRQTGDFIEVLLQDQRDAVYMTIIEDDSPNSKGKKFGFDGRLHDFQMLVGENGNGTRVWTTTTYYFYVELE